MKRFNLLAMVALSTLLLSSCEIIGGIFKAGMFTGVVIVVIVLVLVIWLLAKLLGGNKR